MTTVASKKDLARAFGEVLRIVRTQRGISQDQLSLLVETVRTYPSLLERGLRAPTLVMVLRLAEGVGVTPESLIAETVARLKGDSG
jgi:XRE family transcriptional regulator, regulator of sulfur utilization